MVEFQYWYAFIVQQLRGLGGIVTLHVVPVIVTGKFNKTCEPSAGHFYPRRDSSLLYYINITLYAVVLHSFRYYNG